MCVFVALIHSETRLGVPAVVAVVSPSKNLVEEELRGIRPDFAACCLHQNGSAMPPMVLVQSKPATIGGQHKGGMYDSKCVCVCVCHTVCDHCV